jgi:flagellar protein FliL
LFHHILINLTVKYPIFKSVEIIAQGKPMADEEKEEESGEEGAEPKKKPVLLIVIVIVALLLIVAIVVFAMMLSGSDEEEQMAADGQTQSKSSGAKDKDLLTVGSMYELESLTVNLLNENGRRYLKTTINLEMSSEDLMPELDMKKAVIRDLIIQVLASKQIEEISTLNGKKRLKEEMINALNRRLVDGNVDNVYFTEFVMQ